MSAVPTPYVPSFNFESFSTNNPNTPQPGVQLDAQFNAIKSTTDQVISRLSQIQRDDGNLANGSVLPESLSASILSILVANGCVIRGQWLTATAYAVKDVVTQNGSTYVCAVAHTSGTFVTDLSAVKWVLLSYAVQGSRTFTDTTARNAAVPDFVGQLGTQLDTNSVYVATLLTAGSWTIMPVVLANIADGTITMAKLTTAMNLTGKTLTLDRTAITGATVSTTPATTDKFLVDDGTGLKAMTNSTIMSQVLDTGGAVNLSVQMISGNGSVFITADKLVMSDSNNRKAVRTGVNVSLATPQTSGSALKLDTGGTPTNNTWYWIWAVAGGSSYTGNGYIMSLSATNPTMPTGATYKLRLGPLCMLVYDNSVLVSGTTVGMVQYGTVVHREAFSLLSGASGSTTYAFSGSLSTGTPGYIPSSGVIAVRGYCGRSTSGSAVFQFTSDTGTTGIQQIGVNSAIVVDSIYGGAPFRTGLWNGGIYYKMDSTSSIYSIKLTGFDLNV